MTGSFVKLTFHCVFGTKNRVAVLYDDMRPRLHGYIASVINSDLGVARKVGGMDDHVHILCDIKPDVDISHFMSRIKSVSSGWIHREFPNLADMRWQEGFGAFTVSQSVAPEIVRYIDNQHIKHHKFGFRAEFRRMLQQHDIDFDEEYLR